MSNQTNVPVAELEALVAGFMATAGVSEPNAKAIARALVLAEIDGLKGHGLSRIDSYAQQARTGKAVGDAEPVINRTRQGTLMIDVCHGFAYGALEKATDMLPDMARECGIAAAGFVRSHHAGALGQAAERLASSGMLALMFANTPHAMTAWGGRRPLFGTNPIAFAAPRRDAHPIVIDLALSEVARGKILSAAQKGQSIPLGWAKDVEGNPTTDASAALKGTVEPAGGAKGAALAFMVEVLAASLVGAHQSFEASSFFDGEGPPPAVGQLIIAIDPGAFAGTEAFAEKIGTLAAAIEADEGTRLPGSRKADLRAAADRDGVPVNDDLLAKLKGAA